MSWYNHGTNYTNRPYEIDIDTFKKTATCILPADIRHQDPKSDRDAWDLRI